VGWLVIGGGIAVVWLWWAVFRPFADCGWCDGSGKKRSGRRFRRCRWCKGQGARQVLGSRQVHKAMAAVRGRAWKDGKW
jgi:hypothetical protein